MEFAALAAWVLAALAGGYLLITWFANGGLATKVTRFPRLVVAGHPLAAGGGLALWIGHLATGDPVYAWWAFAALIVVVMQGFLLFTRWLVGRGRHARGAEQAFPAAAVAVHGAVAVATVVLVFLTAMEVTAAP
ncbi:hypothetical protein [Actinomadura sp. WAC 06369]|uniref:hypothetical protein n=1 Tax=Actinomadura sp. WAC 06369 TaxID=2203193 RepID=UPI000F7922BC|nr:hypothetical protein [Actinomadura sp. WAC 06369]RSN64376.1 hypothetical protein DMH08_17690 [Actinomadura sp. WAC 06369]